MWGCFFQKQEAETQKSYTRHQELCLEHYKKAKYTENTNISSVNLLIKYTTLQGALCLQRPLKFHCCPGLKRVHQESQNVRIIYCSNLRGHPSSSFEECDFALISTEQGKCQQLNLGQSPEDFSSVGPNSFASNTPLELSSGSCFPQSLTEMC